MIGLGAKYLTAAGFGRYSITAASLGSLVMLGKFWLTVATKQAIMAAFGATDGKAVIRATNEYLNGIAAQGAAGKAKATALAGFINEHPLSSAFFCYYQPCEYIESTGTQWIDLGYYPLVNDMIYGDLQISTTTGVKNACTCFADKNGHAGMGAGGAQEILYWFNNNDYGEQNINRLPQRSPGRVKFKTGYDGTGYLLWYNGTGAGTDSKYVAVFAGADISVKTLLLFAHNGSGGVSVGTAGRCYNEQILTNAATEIKHNYVPCYHKTTGEIGVYDVYGDKMFRGNSGTGTFNKGSDVPWTPPTP